MALPEITDRATWLAARTDLLEGEKALTRARDALNAKRRQLPMVEVTDAGYRFVGPRGEVPLLALFEGRRQLIVYHFMFQPDWDEGCPSCSSGAVEVAQGFLDHLHDRDTTYVYSSRAPYDKLAAWKAHLGHPVPHYSTVGDAFNLDLGVTFDAADRPVSYNYRSAAAWAEHGWDWFSDEDRMPFDLHGHSVFLRDGDRVFHTYSMYGRGAETVGGSYYYLDLTALGRQEDWEEPADRTDATRGADPSFGGDPAHEQALSEADANDGGAR